MNCLMNSRRMNPRIDGFSLIEVMISMGIVGVLFLANMAAISMHRIQGHKEKELAILADFCTHYFEQIRGIPFDAVNGGEPINALYNGRDSAPDIRIPADPAWFSIETEDYQSFHPELVVLANRELEMRCVLTAGMVDGRPHTKHLALELRWNPPLGRGEKLSMRMDLVRVRDL